ncbi:hypothetical protein [Dehalococcoides mccartyi]|uniref:DUF6874 family protein n=1 Tax=Dehalococcoides mccartyi TaxID=61435 RepID=UPI000804EC80|nr:hypothetical protein [Dehalococcoides mccartyi]OBW62030.1 MAG: hypothetical protein A9181_03430 [Dehalococcoides mccartyi]
MPSSEIQFVTNKKDLLLIEAIADRAVKELQLDKVNTGMDLSACHANGNPLRLKELLETDSYNFAHDIFGIYKFINRDTGKLENCFRPRYSELTKREAS